MLVVKILMFMKKLDVSEKQNMDNLVEKTAEPLLHIRSVFPFTIFIDTVTIDRTKVLIVYREFFYQRTEFPIYIADLKSVKVEAGPLFATISFEIEGYEQNPAPISYIPRSKAFELRKLLTGLIAATRDEVETAEIPVDTLKKKAKRIGSVS